MSLAALRPGVCRCLVIRLRVISAAAATMRPHTPLPAAFKHRLARFVLSTGGPCLSVDTACSSLERSIRVPRDARGEISWPLSAG